MEFKIDNLEKEDELPQRKVAEIRQIQVDCTCGEQHLLPFGDVSTYVCQGCESCGYGGGTVYNYTCPTTTKEVSIETDDY